MSASTFPFVPQRADAIDRYIRVARWARRRYEVDGLVTISVGGVLSRYSRIERMAWNRYLARKGEIEAV